VGLGGPAIEAHCDAVETGTLEPKRHPFVYQCAIGADIRIQTALDGMPQQCEKIGSKQRLSSGEGKHSDTRISQLVDDPKRIAGGQILLFQDFGPAVGRTMHTMRVAAASDFPGDVNRRFGFRIHNELVLPRQISSDVERLP
jgi:hypothetical protein